MPAVQDDVTDGHPPLEQRWMRIVPSLRDAEMRIRWLRLELEQSGLDQAAAAMEQIAAGAEQADERAREVLAAAAPTLADPTWTLRLDALRGEATRRGHLALARLLRQRVPAPPGPAETPDGPPLATTAAGRPLTLGERKAYARRPDRFMLDRLLRDRDPTVIRNVLGNPRITEDDVVRLAARRPNVAVVLEEVARHAKWSASLRVRRALVLNPHTPAAVAVPILSLLLRHELVEVTEATSLPALIRAAAIELLERRPPIRHDETGTPTTH